MDARDDHAELEVQSRNIMIENGELRERCKELEKEVQELRTSKDTAVQELGRLELEIEGLRTESRKPMTPASQHQLNTGLPGETAVISSDKVLASAPNDDLERLNDQLQSEVLLLRTKQQESRNVISGFRSNMEKLRRLTEKERETATYREMELKAKIDELQKVLHAERQASLCAEVKNLPSSCDILRAPLPCSSLPEDTHVTEDTDASFWGRFMSNANCCTRYPTATPTRSPGNAKISLQKPSIK